MNERNTLRTDSILDRSLDLVKVDFAPTHRQPSNVRVLLATFVSLVGSLAADAALVAIGKAAFPSTKTYVHFQFHDYAKLTIIGVIIACVAWPIVTRISSAPRWLFFRMAIVGDPGAAAARPLHSRSKGNRQRRSLCSCACTSPSGSSPTTHWFA